MEELGAVGYTVLPPDKVAGPEFVERLRAAMCRVVKRRHDIDLDVNPEELASFQGGALKALFFILSEDPAFQGAFLNPAVLALVEYLLGRSCVIHACNGLVKGLDGGTLDLHTDNAALGIPAPYPAFEMIINCTWLLSEYSREADFI